MINQFVEKFIDKYLNKWFKEFKKKKVDVGFTKTEFLMENITLNPTNFTTPNLPLSLHFSHIELVSLTLPMTKISSKAAELLIQDLFLCLRVLPDNEWNLSILNTYESKIEFIQNFRRSFLAELNNIIKDNRIQDKDDSGIIKKLMVKVIKNLVVCIKNIHVRFESESDPGFIAGFTLDEIRLAPIETANSNVSGMNSINGGNMSLTNSLTHYKLAKLDSLNIYLGPQYKSSIMTMNKIEFVESCKMNSWKSLYPKICSITTEFKIYFKDFQKFSEIARAKVVLEVPDFDLSLSSLQIQAILKTFNFFERYRNELNCIKEIFDYRLFRPERNILDSKKSGHKSKIISSWWKYAAWSSLHSEMLKKKR